MTFEFGVMVFLLCMLPGLRAAFHRVMRGEMELQARRNAIIREYRASDQSLRLAARWSLGQKRDIARVLEKISSSESQTEAIRAEAATVGRNTATVKWVVDGAGRQMSGRYPFSVKAANPCAAFARAELPEWSARSWKEGRVILMGGLSQIDARRRLEAKYPATSGFEISAL